METGRKKALALASLSMILLASLASVAPIPPAFASIVENRCYWVMGIERKDPGSVVIRDSLDEAPESDWDFAIPSLLVSQNITFSEPWFYNETYGWIVNLTVPATTYAGISYMFYDSFTTFWIRIQVSMSQDGYGWIFLNGTGDVDCHTFSNNTAAYWRSPSPFAGELAALTGQLPSNGIIDGVAGTGDDGFGDGTPDPAGSSILILPTTMTAQFHDGSDWRTLFTFSWPQVFTTGNASAKVIEPDGGPGAKKFSQIDGAYQTEVGQPWEFYAGLDHPGQQVNWQHQNSTAYVTYVCAWSLLDIYTALKDYDICFAITEKLVRDDLLIADVNCDEIVDIYDVTLVGLAYKAKDQNFGPDKTPYTGDDVKVVDPDYDGRVDLKDARGEIDIYDLSRCCLDYKKTLRP